MNAVYWCDGCGFENTSVGACETCGWDDETQSFDKDFIAERDCWHEERGWSEYHREELAAE